MPYNSRRDRVIDTLSLSHSTQYMQTTTIYPQPDMVYPHQTVPTPSQLTETFISQLCDDSGRLLYDEYGNPATEDIGQALYDASGHLVMEAEESASYNGPLIEDYITPTTEEKYEGSPMQSNQSNSNNNLFVNELNQLTDANGNVMISSSGHPLYVINGVIYSANGGSGRVNDTLSAIQSLDQGEESELSLSRKGDDGSMKIQEGLSSNPELRHPESSMLRRSLVHLNPEEMDDEDEIELPLSYRQTNLSTGLDTIHETESAYSSLRTSSQSISCRDDMNDFI